MSAWSFVAEAGAAERDVVRAASPLAVDLFLQCGPVRVPIAVSALDATLEHEDSEPARLLRSFLSANPWEGMGSVTPDRWMLLAQGDETVVFGQRHGPLGLGPVVTMSRRDARGALGDHFRARAMDGGARPVLGGAQKGSGWPEPSFRARVGRGSPAVVHAWWDCSQDLAFVPHRVHARTELVETADEVHYLLISAPNPDYRPDPSGFEVGTGRSAEASFALAAPLGDRALFSDYGAPATRVLVEPEAAP